MNFHAASCFLLVFWMAQAHVYSQPDALVFLTGACDVADLALDRGVVGLERAGGGRGVVPHRDLALLHGVQALGEAGLRGAVLAVLLDQVDVEVGGLLELRRVDLGVQSLSNQVPPKVLTTVVSGRTPRPSRAGRAGRCPSCRAARRRPWRRCRRPAPRWDAGIVMPFVGRTSLRYIRNDDSP